MNTTTIKIRLSRPDGTPVIGGQVVAQLEGVGISDLDGLISQARMEAVTDETGQASLALWPSANGVSGVEYRIVARSDDGRKVIDEMVNVIESAEPVRLTDILMVPPPSPKPYDEAAIEAIRADRVLAQQAADTSTTNAAQTAADRQQTGLDRQATAADRARAETARQEAEALYGDLTAVEQAKLDAQAAHAGADTAADQAAASAQAAATSEANADQSEAAALASQQAAAASETNAANSATAAAASEDNASASESAALASEQAADQSEALAEQWATSQGLVDGVNYGAKKYALDASASQAAAAQSETNAATSETNDANSASAAASSATDAANSAASINAADIVHAPGSGLANEAGSAAFADTGDFDAAGAAAGAQAYSIQRANHTGTQTLSTISDAGTAAGADVEAFDPAGRAVAVTPTAFAKADGSRPGWTAPTGTTLEAASNLALVVGSTLVEIAAGTAITLPALAAGIDYTIYAAADGTLQAVDADAAAPIDTRKVGGFHVSAGGTAIVASSLWDLNWRPSTPNPRGMVLSLDGRIWADIYLADVDYALNGYSRNGQQIADDLSLPKIPAEYGGDGIAAYASASWWSFNDILSSAGKRFPHYQEFTALAYGVVERQAVGTDPGTTQHQAGHRSACGVEQVTGVMWQWGADITGTSATGAAAWNDWADGRGDIYTHSIRSPLFGAGWSDGTHAGSRASYWNVQPGYSSSGVGARGVCDHLNLQAER